MADKDILSRIIQRLRDLQPTITEEVAEKLKEQVQQEYGGERAYIKKIDPDRKEKVLKRFNGRNGTVVARDLGVPRRTFYRMLRSR